MITVREQQRLRELLAQQVALIAKRDALLNKPVVNLARFYALDRKVGDTTARIKKLNDTINAPERLSADRSRAFGQLRQSLQQVTQNALIASTAIGGVMIATARHFDPAAAKQFEYRLGDLAAVTGEVLAPSFKKLSDSVKGVSDMILNASPGTKALVNTIASAVAPLLALTAGFGVASTVARSFFRLANNGWKSFSALAGLAGPATGKAITGLGRAVIGGGVGAIAGGAIGQHVGGDTGGTIGAVAGGVGGSVLAASAPKLLPAAKGVASGVAATATGGLTTSALAGGGIIAAIAGLGAAIGDGLLKKITGYSVFGYQTPEERAAEEKNQKQLDSTGRDALRPVSYLGNDALEVGRRMNVASLSLAGAQKPEDIIKSKQPVYAAKATTEERDSLWNRILAKISDIDVAITRGVNNNATAQGVGAAGG